MTKRVLGRGLDALIPQSPERAQGREDEILHVPLARLDLNPEQPRKAADPEGIDELARSIEEYGILEPVIVKRESDRFVLIAGERRVTAAKRAGLETVPAIVKSLNDRDMLAVALIENIQRENLNPVDEALAYQRLRDGFTLTQEEIARRVGKSRVAVANALRLLQLDAPMLQDVSRGTLTAGHARALLAVDDETARRALWERIKADKLSVRDSEREAQSSTPKRTGAKKPAARRRTNPQIAHLEEQLRQVLGTQVRILPKGEAGRIEVAYYTAADLERLLESMGVHFE